MRARTALCALGLALFVPLVAGPRASADSAWIEAGDIPLPDWAKSVEIVRDDEALSSSPGGPRRGLVAAGVRLPLLGATRGPGCVSRWLLVGPLAYICSDKAKLSAEPAGVDASIHPVPTDAMPYRYYFVGKEGADAFAKLADVDDESPAEQLERGWSIAGVSEVTHKGANYVLTRKGRFVPRAEVGAIVPFAFHGETINKPEIDFGWILPEKTNVLSDAKSSAKVVGVRTRLQKIDVLESKKVGKDTFLRIGDAQWVNAAATRVPTVAPKPDEVPSNARWMDVELASQTLVAYEGDKPVFATVVSTGKVPGTTPKGLHKIWVKLRSTTMSNADDAKDTNDDSTPYSIEDVPWVQYFSNGVALHGAFWHRKFGNVNSHGCVNLTPLDAMRLFDWSLPRLPRGWDAVFPTTAEPASFVRVR